MQEYPLLFEMEVLNRLSVPDHFALAGVSREARAAMFTFEPIAFLTRDNFMPHEDIRHQCRYACTEACKEGRVDVLRWLTLDPSYEMDRRWSYHAARNGHVHVLEWLLDEGCSLAEDAASGAAEGGHLEALKWLVNHGCPWSGSVWNYAVKGTARGGDGVAEGGGVRGVLTAHFSGENEGRVLGGNSCCGTSPRACIARVQCTKTKQACNTPLAILSPRASNM